MKERSSGNHERKQTERKRNGEAREHRRAGGNQDNDQFGGDGTGERGPRNSASGTPPASASGDSHGAPREADSDGEWRDSSGAYGFPGYRDAPGEAVQRSGYGEQGFGAGESRGGRWGGGERGGYGGGEPGGLHGTRGGGWAAAGQRYEQGRGPRSYGPEGWGGTQAQSGQTPEPGAEQGTAERSNGWGRSAGEQPGQGGSRAAGHQEHPGGYDESEAPWRKSEFAGRGEFGERDYGRPAGAFGWEARAHTGAAGHYAERWMIPGRHTGRGPEGYSRSEAAIREDVCERLTRHGDLDASRIRVEVEHGEVMLDGVVDSRQSKRMAEEAVETVSGVRDIHNRLHIEHSHS